MRHLDEITIDKFRGIRNLKLENLGQINLLVGVNNSGKTSVLEAISLYCDPLSLQGLLATAKQRESGIIYSRISPLDALFWMFPHDHSIEPDILYKGEINLSGNGTFPLRKLEILYQAFEGVEILPTSNTQADVNGEDEEDGENNKDDEDIFSETPKGVYLELKATVEEQDLLGIHNKEITTEFELWENKRLITSSGKKSLKLPVVTITPFSHRSESVQAKLLTQARFSNFKDELINLLQQIDSGIEDIEILTPQRLPIVYIQHKKLGLSPLSNFGDGVRRLLFIATKLVSVKEGILLIDEIETAIHTEALDKSFSWLVYWCQKLDVQLFATTHSLEAIDTLLDATTSDNSLVAYRLEKTDIETKAVRFDQDLLHTLREELGQEIR